MKVLTEYELQDLKQQCYQNITDTPVHKPLDSEHFLQNGSTDLSCNFAGTDPGLDADVYITFSSVDTNHFVIRCVYHCISNLSMSVELMKFVQCLHCCLKDIDTGDFSTRTHLSKLSETN